MSPQVDGPTDEFILLVEDNPDDVDLTLRAFRKVRIANRIVVVRDGQEALDFLHGTGSHAERDVEHTPQVVLLDLKLPRLDGLEVLRRMRADERTRLVPVVILTSSKHDEDRIAGYLNGANSYVCKPVDMVQFLDAVRQLGIYWLLLNQRAPGREDTARSVA
jgi:two-component system response regulator